MLLFVTAINKLVIAVYSSFEDGNADDEKRSSELGSKPILRNDIEMQVPDAIANDTVLMDKLLVSVDENPPLTLANHWH